VGNAIGIQGLIQVKSNVDSGIFKAIQKAAIAAYSTSEAELAGVVSIYQNRRDIIVKGLQSLGWPIQPPQATLYVWVPVPPGYSSTEFVNLLLDKCGILVPSGNGYGAAGEGFFRIALTIPDERMHEAIQRLKDAGIRYEGLEASSLSNSF
jgi:LL-diaminopimelate aminotransferase